MIRVFASVDIGNDLGKVDKTIDADAVTYNATSDLFEFSKDGEVAFAISSRYLIYYEGVPGNEDKRGKL